MIAGLSISFIFALISITFSVESFLEKAFWSAGAHRLQVGRQLKLADKCASAGNLNVDWSDITVGKINILDHSFSKHSLDLRNISNLLIVVYKIFNTLYSQIGYPSVTGPHLSGSNYLISAKSEVCDCAMQLPGGTVCVHARLYCF